MFFLFFLLKLIIIYGSNAVLTMVIAFRMSKNLGVVIMNFVFKFYFINYLVLNGAKMVINV